MSDPETPAATPSVWANAYIRCPDGTWVYASDQTPVPGATDLTRSALHQVRHFDDQVFVPSQSLELDPTLRLWLESRGLQDEIVGLGRGVLVPVDEWAAKDTWVGMAAPELHLWAVMTLGEISELAGYSESTLRVQRSRGVLVGPQRTVGRTPLWARPVIERWVRARDASLTDSDRLVFGPEPRLLTEPRALELVLGAVRAMFGCEDPDEIVALLVQTAHRLGGWIVAASEADARAIPLNLSLGYGEPLLATPDPADPRATQHLQAHLPQLVEDARHAIARLGRGPGLAMNEQLDALTGLPDRSAYDRLAARLGSRAVLLLFDLEELSVVNDIRGRTVGDEVLRAFGAVLRDQSRVGEPVIRYGDDEFLVVFLDDDLAGAERFLGRVQLAWEQRRPLPIDFAAGVAAVTTRADAALESAERSLSADKLRRQTVRRGEPGEP